MKARSKLVENLVVTEAGNYVAKVGGKVLNPGDKVKSFRGETYYFLYVSRGPEYNGTAKVVVTRNKKKTGPSNEEEYYDRVFDIVVTPAGAGA